jgi:hypothetical protein
MRLVESPRQCVFAGTVNHSTYLRDETGGCRFWPVACGRIDIEALASDRDQRWAEAKARFDAGSVWWLDTAELIQLAANQQVDRYEGDAGKKSWLRGQKRDRARRSARCSKNVLPNRKPSGLEPTRSGQLGACEHKARSATESGLGTAWSGVTERRAHFCCARSFRMDRGMFAAARQSFNPIFKAAFHSIRISGFQAQGQRRRLWLSVMRSPYRVD